MKKHVLLTFDYELFLGKRSGTVDNCLIKPTNMLLEILNRNNAKAVFFIDTTYLMRLTEIKNTYKAAQEDYNKIENQLIHIARQGHYLFHHLHPHWLDAIYIEEINQWDLSNISRFAFAALKESDKDRIFSFSYHFLTEIYSKAGVDEKCNGFRAGGLFIEPFTAFKPYFEKYGIKYDFSVVPGDKNTYHNFSYDFSELKQKTPYHFDNHLIEIVNNGSLAEFPISTVEIKGLIKILNALYNFKYKNNTKNKIYGDGAFVVNDSNNKKTKKDLRKYFYFYTSINLEILTPVLLHLFKKIIKKTNYLHFLSHPKLLSSNNIKNTDRLLSYCNRKYDMNYDFKKITINY